MSPHPFDHAWSRRPARPATGPHVGLTCDVIARILDEPRLQEERITVEVQNRVVGLPRTVSSLHARVTAADLARTTPGVTDICNKLELRPAADVTAALEGLQPIRSTR